VSRARKPQALAAVAAAVALTAPAVAATTSPEYFLAYQHAWLQDRSPLKVASKARRTGLTFAEAFDAVYLRITGQRIVDYWYSGADETTAREFMEAVRLFARDILGKLLEMVVGHEVIDGKSIRTFEVRLPAVVGPGGQVREPRITAMTSSPGNFRSKGGDVCLDEFAIHADQGELWAAASMCANWGGVIRIISTHPTTPNLFDELVAMGARRIAGAPKPLDKPVSLHVIDIDRAIAHGLVERINQKAGMTWTRDSFREHVVKMAGDRADTELFCKTGEQQSSYLPFELLRPCVLPGLPRMTHDGRSFFASLDACAAGADAVYAGCDVGRKTDRFAVAAIIRHGGMHRVGPLLVWQGRPFDEMEGFLHQVMRAEVTVQRSGGDRRDRVRRLVIDNAGLGMQMAERMEQRYRTRVEGVNTGTASVREDGWTRVRAMVEERTVGLPDDLGLLGQFSGVRKILTAGKHDRFDVERNEHGHGDAATAVMLGLMAAGEPASVGYMVKGEML